MKTIEYKIDNYEITEYNDYYRIIEGLTYWEDHNHFGTIFITQAMYDKYDLGRCGCCETIKEAYGEYDEDFMPGRQYTHVIHIDHCAGVTPLGVDASENTMDTPHGEVHDEDFVAWWCEFPVELLSEPEENVQITGWWDG